MTATTPEAPAAAPATPGPADPGAPQPDSAGEETQGAPQEPEQPQNAWAAREDLRRHVPPSMDIEGGAHGGVFGGTNFGVAGDVHHHYSLGWGGAATSTSGEIPRQRLERLADGFVSEGTSFDALLDRLREERVLVLTGRHTTGRRAAASMLVHKLGADSVHALERDCSPADLVRTISRLDEESAGDGATGLRGYVLSDLVTRRDRPLSEAHVLALRSQLGSNGALVITTDQDAYLEDHLPVHEWEPPTAEMILNARLTRLVGEDATGRLLALPAVNEFLLRGHHLHETLGLVPVLLRQALHDPAAEPQLLGYSLTSLERQVQQWLEEDESTLHLRDKAFLLALAAFDGSPYALTAELGDLLYGHLQRTEHPGLHPVIPVFGTNVRKRLQLARALRYPEDEQTEWGPVTQLKARFQDDRTAHVLLREVWTGHPSARPALIGWLLQLSDDGRPLVRTRAASTAALLARDDLPSALALIIEPWAHSDRARRRLSAVNALALAHIIGTPNIPRIIDGWCTDDEHPELCWAAIRVHGLIGPERPAETLAALRASYRRQLLLDDSPLLDELGQAVALLLHSGSRDQVLAELRAHADADPVALDLALRGFLDACEHSADGIPYGRPLVLDWYARSSVARSPAAPAIAALWRAVLADPERTPMALDVLHDWLVAAESDTDTEWALASLLPALVTTPEEYHRLSHLLRERPAADGSPPPPVGRRLVTVLPSP
ncbi:hypothetical protein ACFXDJ_30355 [Streptomyces sp. NPDC059443]|uniref:hypothetical protein n=1 Tax=unclassified Streptomyces TaxID=2593676 RepID=UPI0036946A8E